MARIDVEQQYAEAGALVRHYSTARIGVLSFLIPLCFAMGAVAISEINDIAFIGYVLVVELVVFGTAIFTSILFSTLSKKARDWMIRVESGAVEKSSLHNHMNKVTLRRPLIVDEYDSIIIKVGGVLHIAFYIYLLVTILSQ